jgi:hypothetical protein
MNHLKLWSPHSSEARLNKNICFGASCKEIKFGLLPKTQCKVKVRECQYSSSMTTETDKHTYIHTENSL